MGFLEDYVNHLHRPRPTGVPGWREFLLVMGGVLLILLVAAVVISL